MISILTQPSILISLLALIVAIVAAVLAYPPFRSARHQKKMARFREIRNHLVANRASLALSAAELYRRSEFISGSNCLTRDEWVLGHPVSLDSVLVSYSPEPRHVVISGESQCIRRLLPVSRRKAGLRTYSDFVGADASIRPGLFWNGPSYDLRSLRRTGSKVTIELGPTHYFDTFDVCEALAHEFAAGRQRERASLRKRVGDPTDLSARIAVPALAWLMVIRENDGCMSFLLHARDGNAVASDGQLMQVFGGQLQPSSRHALDARSEATLWKSFVREFAEELLGFAEASGEGGGAISYSTPPFTQLAELRDSGRLRVALLGLGIDPLSAWPTLLCISIIDRRAFGEILPDIVRKNDEGIIVGSRREGERLFGFAFEEDVIGSLCQDVAVGAVTVACLRLAWQHRDWLNE